MQLLPIGHTHTTTCCVVSTILEQKTILLFLALLSCMQLPSAQKRNPNSIVRNAELSSSCTRTYTIVNPKYKVFRERTNADDNNNQVVTKPEHIT